MSSSSKKEGVSLFTKTKKLIAALSLAVMGAISLTGCGNERAVQDEDTKSDTIVLRYSEIQVQDYPTTIAAKKFVELVNDGTQGRVVIDIYDNAKIATEDQVAKDVKFGRVDLTRVSLSALSEVTKELEVLQLPYLYRDSEHMWKVLDGDIDKEFLTKMDKDGIIGLAWNDGGSRSFYNSKREIKSLEDMKDLKIRVQESLLMEDLVKTLGADPVPMPYGEIPEALKAGKLDGAENSWPSYESQNHYKYAKYYTLDEHSRIPEIMIISKRTLDRLSPTDQHVIRMCAIEAAKYERELWAKREADSKKKVVDAGTVVTELSEAEKAKFVEAVQPIYQKYAAGQMELVKRIRDVK